MTLDDQLAQAIMTLTTERGAQKSICPSDAAKAVGAERGQDWHELMTPVRRVAVRLAVGGQIAILRKGKPVDPQDFRGVYRLQIARQD